MSDAARDYWNGQAADVDRQPDHSLSDPPVREAWRRLLLQHLPPAPADVLDLGCGTGTLSVLLAREGYRLRGVQATQLSPTSSVTQVEVDGTVDPAALPRPFGAKPPAAWPGYAVAFDVRTGLTVWFGPQQPEPSTR